MQTFNNFELTSINPQVLPFVPLVEEERASDGEKSTLSTITISQPKEASTRRVATNTFEAIARYNEEHPLVGKFLITGLVIGGIDLASSLVNPLPEVHNNTFGKLKTNSEGLALLSSMLESNIIAETIYGPWESVFSNLEQLAVTGSQVGIAILCDLIGSKTLGMSSSIAMTVAWNLLCRTLSCAMYKQRTYKVLEAPIETDAPINLQKRYLANGLLIVSLDFAAALLNRTTESTSLSSMLSTLAYGSFSSRFSVMLYAQVNQHQKKWRALVGIGRLLSLIGSQVIMSLALPEKGFSRCFEPTTALGTGHILLLVMRMLLDNLYDNKKEQGAICKTGLEATTLYDPNSASRGKIMMNAILLGAIDISMAIANRSINSQVGILFSNTIHAVANLQFSRALFENVRAGWPQALVVIGQLLAAFATEQIANSLIGGVPVPSGWTRYIGRMTCIAISTASTFLSTMFVNRVWRQPPKK
jgi:hypothetical protein